MQDVKALYDQVYIAGLQSKIRKQINQERNRKVGHNTIYLALKDPEPSTPLRARIQEIARELLAQMETPEPFPLPI